MKKLLLLVLLSGFFIACSSDSSDDLQDNDTTMENSSKEETPTTVKLTYTKDIAVIIKDNCLACHGSPTQNGAPSSFTSFTAVNSAALRMQNRMNSETNPMPKSGLLAKDVRAKFDQWITDGKLE